MHYLHFCLPLHRFEGTQQNFGFAPQKKPEMKKGSIGSGYDADEPSWCTLILHFHSHDIDLVGAVFQSTFSSVFTNSGPGAKLCVVSLGFSV